MNELLRFERALWKKGLRCVAGVDEAGMGPLAGPVVSAAVIFPPGVCIKGIRDSKTLSSVQRQEFAWLIKKRALTIGVGVAVVAEIDRLNIYHAGLLAMGRAVRRLTPQPDYILTDARTIPGLLWPQQGIVRGDSRSQSIAAASIVAKVLRDSIMDKYDEIYSGYGFNHHRGYPTKEHQLALAERGPCPIHRRSFTSVAEFSGQGSREFYRLRSALSSVSDLRQCKKLEGDLHAAALHMTAYETRKLRALWRRAVERSGRPINGPQRALSRSGDS